jgi:hypothetical protein
MANTERDLRQLIAAAKWTPEQLLDFRRRWNMHASLMEDEPMAKRPATGGGLGRKEVVPADSGGGMRESAIGQRVEAFDTVVGALRALTPKERTHTIAAVAEFYCLSLTVEN